PPGEVPRPDRAGAEAGDALAGRGSGAAAGRAAELPGAAVGRPRRPRRRARPARGRRGAPAPRAPRPPGAAAGAALGAPGGAAQRALPREPPPGAKPGVRDGPADLSRARSPAFAGGPAGGRRGRLLPRPGRDRRRRARARRDGGPAGAGGAAARGAGELPVARGAAAADPPGHRRGADLGGRGAGRPDGARGGRLAGRHRVRRRGDARPGQGGAGSAARRQRPRGDPGGPVHRPGLGDADGHRRRHRGGARQHPLPHRDHRARAGHPDRGGRGLRHAADPRRRAAGDRRRHRAGDAPRGDPMSEPSRQVTWARAVIRRRGWVLAGVAALTAALASQAVKVRPDYSVELLFPVWDPARKVYDRFKAEFPYEDTRAVVIVEGRGLLERDALGRLKSLEADLARTPSVDEVIGPTSARTVTMEVDGPRLLPLLPGPEVDDARLAYARKVLSTDPLFARNVVGPDGGSVSIVLRLDPKVAGTDEGRQRISHDLRAVLDRHGDLGDRRILSGVPALRASFAAMIARDAGTLVPLALLAVTVLLALAFRDVRAVAAGLLTILLSLAWSYGVLGALGYPISMMVSVLPIIVMIICVSDTVHLIHHFLGERRAGQPPREAAALALADSAIPCLLTEIVVACGFASLVAVNITAILQFGVAAAISVLLVWVANVTI